MNANQNVNLDGYPVVEVPPEWRLDDEWMGSKDKFWFRCPSDNQRWLFKIPTAGTGQHWAEKVAFEIARKMQIDTPQVELAWFRNAQDDEIVLGSATVNFTVFPGDAAKKIKRLLNHGNQILSDVDDKYDPEKRFGQSMHTVPRIFASMDIFESEQYAEECRAVLAEYLLLDAVVCNVDRHHENWGIVFSKIDGVWHKALAPTFDHASSLGRELQDSGGKQNRQRYLQELGVERYVARGRGAVFIDEAAKRAPPPVEVVEWCLKHRDLSRYFQQALGKLADIDDDVAVEIVRKIPDNWMSAVAKEFVHKLVAYNLTRLKSFTQ